MTATILRADAAHLPIPDASVDLVCTSPPYFGLRSYTDGGAHYEGQVGDEATPAEYLDALIACTAEGVRVLKPGGSLFINLGDKYAGSRMDGSNDNGSHGTMATKHRAIPLGQRQPRKASAGSNSTKSLIGLPWRYALRCIDDVGLILRAEIVWSKPNGLPESVTDRVRRSHEQVFHLVKQPRYFSAVDEVREDHSPHTLRYYSDGSAAVSGRRKDRQRGHGRDPETRGANFPTTSNPLGKLPGSVWTIATAPLTVPGHLGIDHFAAYPPELVRRIVLGWSPREVCTGCGEGRRPVSERRALSGWTRLTPSTRGRDRDGVGSGNEKVGAFMPAQTETTITGYACACADTTAPSTPGVVLDPFGGTGTTALVASVNGRRGISVDMSADYCRLARWRTTDPGERARVLGVPKPEPVPEAQMDLFDGAA